MTIGDYGRFSKSIRVEDPIYQIDCPDPEEEKQELRECRFNIAT
jgi:hypothetical protein